MKITPEQIRQVYGTIVQEEGIKEKDIPKECIKCTLLKKDNYKKKLSCLYRTKEGCMLYGMGSR